MIQGYDSRLALRALIVVLLVQKMDNFKRWKKSAMSWRAALLK